MLKPVVAVLAVVLALAGAGSAPAQEAIDKDPALAKLHARNMAFLSGVATGEIQAAFNELLKESQLLKQADEMKTLVARTQEIEVKYGRHRAHERVDARRIGKDLILLRYLYKCQDFPVVWRFVYYRDFARETVGDGENWTLVSVRFDTDLELLEFF